MTQQFEQRIRRLPFAFTHLDPAVRRDIVYLDATDTRRSPSTSCTRAASSRVITSCPN
jgi:hypothetical protein